VKLLPSYGDAFKKISRMLHSPLLPVDHVVALKPWFTKKIIEQGADLLRNEDVRFFTFQRRYGGLVTDDDILVTIKMAQGRGKRPFVFRDGTCSRCIGKSGGTRCKHVAALALLCLREHESCLLPLAELFPKSQWADIGRYLHNRAALSRITSTLQEHENAFVLQAEDDTGLDLQIRLSREAARELHAVCSVHIAGNGRTVQPINSSGDPSLKELQKTLTRLAATPNEQLLNEHGSLSKQQHLDTSLWMHLARLLYLHLPDREIKLKQDGQGIYQLQLPSSPTDDLFRLTLPRLHTWELLDKLSLSGNRIRKNSVEQAEQFSLVSFSPKGDAILVEHCCRLCDGTEYRLKELTGYRYGTRYQRDNHLFSLKAIPEKERLSNQEKGQLSLFSLCDTADTDNKYGFTVPGPAIEQFLVDNHYQLHCNRHRVAPDILDLKIVTLPSELVIDRYTEDRDWCYLAGWYDLGNHTIRLSDLLAAAAEGKSLLSGPTTLQLDASLLSWFHQLGRERIIEDNLGTRIKLRRSELLTLTAQIGTISSTAPAVSGTLPAFLLDSKPLENAVSPDRIAGHLRPYQRHGTTWLYQLQQYRLGGILADDMGLGKTHQALALVDLLADDCARFLLVCPAAVLYHWPEKQKKFFPNLKMTVFHGQGRSLEEAGNAQILVTTYGTLRRDINLFADTTFRLIIFDEMHYLKNRKTATYTAASRLQADSVIGLTGTPVENRIGELATLLSVCLPELFRFQQVRQQFRQGDSPEQRRILQRFVAPFILRRTRKQVLGDLPECSEDIRLCRLSPEQVSAYRQTVEQVEGKLDDLEQSKASADFPQILTTIIRLKQICNHLSLLKKCTDWSLYPSGKWDEFTRLLLQSLDAGLKIVVFSQFTTMLDIIEAWLNREKIEYIGLRGSVAAKERARRITRFNTIKKCRVCCASLLAGGTGIDLTGAQVVIHYDRWWNSAREEQATARVHRLGQHQPVQVYKLITTGTLEEKIHALIDKKQRLAADLVVEDDGSVLKTLNRSELVNLFRYSS